MQHAIYLPPIGTLSEPAALVEIALAAEANGWDGFFLWDHVVFSRREPVPSLDPWLILSAVAQLTHRLRLGPMVTPLPRRHPGQLAREATTLDQLSDGRAILGFGSGGDKRGEFSAFGEPTDPRERASILDEGLSVLEGLWGGTPISHRGTHFELNEAVMLPRPSQKPRIPIWLAAVGGAVAPAQRAARFDGIFPIEVDEDGFSQVVETVHKVRGDLAGYEFAVVTHPGVNLAGFEKRGATWAMHAFWYDNTPSQVLRYVSRPPSG